jgi:hypothetical protein
MWPDPEEIESESNGGDHEGGSGPDTDDSQSEPVTSDVFTKPQMVFEFRALLPSLIVSQETEEESSPPPSQPPPEEAPFTTPDLEEITKGAPPPADDRD